MSDPKPASRHNSRMQITTNIILLFAMSVLLLSRPGPVVFYAAIVIGLVALTLLVIAIVQTRRQSKA